MLLSQDHHQYLRLRLRVVPVRIVPPGRGPGRGCSAVVVTATVPTAVAVTTSAAVSVVRDEVHWLQWKIENFFYWLLLYTMVLWPLLYCPLITWSSSQCAPDYALIWLLNRSVPCQLSPWWSACSARRRRGVRVCRRCGCFCRYSARAGPARSARPTARWSALLLHPLKKDKHCISMPARIWGLWANSVIIITWKLVGRLRARWTSLNKSHWALQAKGLCLFFDEKIILLDFKYYNNLKLCCQWIWSCELVFFLNLSWWMKLLVHTGLCGVVWAYELVQLEAMFKCLRCSTYLCQWWVHIWRWWQWRWLAPLAPGPATAGSPCPCPRRRRPTRCAAGNRGLGPSESRAVGTKPHQCLLYVKLLDDKPWFWTTYLDT